MAQSGLSPVFTAAGIRKRELHASSIQAPSACIRINLAGLNRPVDAKPRPAPDEAIDKGDAMDVEIERPHVRHKSEHNWLDMSVSFAALFVSFVSIFIAWHHGETMRELVHQNERLVQANSLPHLRLFGSNADPAGKPQLAFGVANQGVGPAEIQTVEVLVDGQPVQSLDQLLRACCGNHDYSGVVTSTLLGTMVRPGETISYIRMPVNTANREGAIALDAARRSNRILTRVCYCSVFADCWLRTSLANDRPRVAGQCPSPKIQYEE